MNRIELVQRVAAVMREKNMRKPISAYKQVFHISDDEGNEKKFIIRKPNKEVLFTVTDISAVVETILSVIEETLKKGEPISIRGFGVLYLHYRKARTTKHPGTGQTVDVPARYVPKFDFGKTLRMCGRVFELNLDESDPIPEPVLDDFDDDTAPVDE